MRLTSGTIVRCPRRGGSRRCSFSGLSLPISESLGPVRTFEKDYAVLLRSFNNHGVRYLIVGAFAVGFHAMPRYTKDLDLWVEPTIDNGARICRALEEFGFGSLKIAPNDFARKGRCVQLGYEPIRVDLITTIPGVTFSRAWAHRRRGYYGPQPVFFVGLQDLVRSKKASGRKQDLADLDVLRSARRS